MVDRPANRSLISALETFRTLNTVLTPPIGADAGVEGDPHEARLQART
jgi:hypothetical protein